jgi:hypothetical protein
MPISYDTGLTLAQNKNEALTAFNAIKSDDWQIHETAKAHWLSVLGFTQTKWVTQLFNTSMRALVGLIKKEFSDIKFLSAFGAGSYPQYSAGFLDYYIGLAPDQATLEGLMADVNAYEAVILGASTRLAANVASWNSVQFDNNISIYGFDDDSDGFNDRFTYSGPDAPDAAAQKADMLFQIQALKDRELVERKKVLSYKLLITSCMGSSAYTAAGSPDATDILDALNVNLDGYTPNSGSPYHEYNNLTARVNAVSMLDPWNATILLNMIQEDLNEFMTFMNFVEAKSPTLDSQAHGWVTGNSIGWSVATYDTDGHEATWNFSYP